MFQTTVAATLALAAGHGTVMNPPQWSAGNEMYENYTFIPGKPTIDTFNPLKTMKECPKFTIPSARDSAGNSLGCYGSPGLKPGHGVDATFNHPWRAPGTAPITSPCGIDGGNPLGCPKGNPGWGNCNPGGHGHGTDGRLGINGGKVATWEIGSIQPVEWYVHANHNGGYSYRLCKRPARGMDLTEECFQQNVLRFTGNHLIKYHSALVKNVEIKAMDTTEYTYPKGSMWRRNPIPCCTWLAEGPSTTCPLPSGPQFKAQIGGKGEKLMGYGPFKEWNIVDKVVVPDLPAGDYVLSWRWDTEEFMQVWTSCSHVKLVKGGPPAPVPPSPTPPVPTPGPTPAGPCVDKDHNCTAVSKLTCGTGIGGCIANNCDPAIYDAEVVGYEGNQCMYHCHCKGTPSPVPAPTPPAPTPPAPTPPSPTPAPVPCIDKDHNCTAVTKATCGTGIGGCIKNNCDPAIYDAEVVGYEGHNCMYHCKCLNPGTTIV